MHMFFLCHTFNIRNAIIMNIFKINQIKSFHLSIHILFKAKIFPKYIIQSYFRFFYSNITPQPSKAIALPIIYIKLPSTFSATSVSHSSAQPLPVPFEILPFVSILPRHHQIQYACIRSLLRLYPNAHDVLQRLRVHS